MTEHITNRDHEEDRYYRTHARCQQSVDPSRRLNALKIQERKHRSKKERPSPVWNPGSKNECLLAAPDNADHGVEDVIHHHAPASDIPERWVDLLSDVGECRAGTGISPRHPAIAERGKQHRHHGDEQSGDDMAVAAVAEHAEH